MRDVPDLRETDPECPVGGCRQHPRAHEGVTNRAVALASTKNQMLSMALISAIWGPDIADAHRICGAVIYESGQDTDWLLMCGCSPQPVAIAEHKPTVKPRANDTACLVADYKAAVSAGFITEPVGGYPTTLHEQPHAFRDDCVFCMERNGVCRLVLPQVVVYALRYQAIPRVLVTDFPSADAAWAQWDWGSYIQISDETMSVRHIPGVVDSLACTADAGEVTARELNVLQVIACRLWWRSPCDVWEDGRATDNARTFIRDAEHCYREHRSSWS